MAHDLSGFDFLRSREEEQDIGSFLKLLNVANLDDKSEPSRHFTY